MQGVIAFFQNSFDVIINYGIPFVLTLSIVVFVHEFGHFWVARRCGVKVLSFSIGMGPEIFGFTDKLGTRWRFSLLPVGGYVQMFGDADPASATVDEQAKAMPDAEKRHAFFAQNVYKRIAIIFAGPAMNYIFAFVLLLGMFTFLGVPSQPAIVDTVTPGSAAEVAGIQPGDKILSTDGVAIKNFAQLQRRAIFNDGTPMDLVIERHGAVQHIAVTPKLIETTDRLGNPAKLRRIGISATTKTESYEPVGFVGAITETFEFIGNFTQDTITVISQMIRGTRSTEDLGGPLRIAKIAGDIAKTRDIGWYLDFLVRISLSLGFVNLLPIPLLDGGHIFFYLLEAARRRPMSERFQEYASRVGLGIVLSLMMFTLWNDAVFMKFWPH